MEIGELQRRIRELTRGIEHPRVGAALALGEECGEVLRCVLEREYYGKDIGADLADEVGDVLVALMEICDRFDLSAEACAAAAVEKIARKAPQWRAQLGDHLQALRARMDGPQPS